MAREVLLQDGRTALFDDDATDSDIEAKLREQKLKRHSGPIQPVGDTSAIGPVLPFVASALNSVAFGVPEMAARAMGAGPYIEAARRDFPMSTTAGDIVGLANPYRLAARAGQAGVRSLMSTPQATAEALMRPAGTSAGVGQMARGVAERTAGLGSGVIGAQTGAAALGAARSPDQPMAGAQQGAQVFRDVATNLPGTQLIPGAQSTIGAVTGVVPAALGYGSMMMDYGDVIDRQMREEAARRAMQGSQ